MFEVKTLSTEEIVAKVKAHCAGGIRKGRSPDFPLVGCGNDALVAQIVERSLTWLNTPEKIAERKRLSHQTLAWVVAAETFNLTRENFSWRTVCKVIEQAGEAKLSKGAIDIFVHDHGYAAHVIDYRPELDGSNVKITMSRLAKAILWIEACTFLIEEGFDFNEDRF
ncbi:MAG TPA: hypothetical protein VNU25_00470 [Candidatus Paceibacterota bacterium]|nr:hypothetical protein [Candidatus Paceibacterota bacterium]